MTSNVDETVGSLEPDGIGDVELSDFGQGDGKPDSADQDGMATGGSAEQEYDTEITVTGPNVTTPNFDKVCDALGLESGVHGWNSETHTFRFHRGELLALGEKIVRRAIARFRALQDATLNPDGPAIPALDDETPGVRYVCSKMQADWQAERGVNLTDAAELSLVENHELYADAVYILAALQEILGECRVLGIVGELRKVQPNANRGTVNNTSEW